MDYVTGVAMSFYKHRFSPSWSTRLTNAHSPSTNLDTPDNQEKPVPHTSRTWANGHVAEGGKVHGQSRSLLSDSVQ